jgi:hypothetical protein
MKLRGQLIAKKIPPPHDPMRDGMLLRGQRLQVVQAVIESVAVGAVQRCLTVAEVSVSAFTYADLRPLPSYVISLQFAEQLRTIPGGNKNARPFEGAEFKAFVTRANKKHRGRQS